MPSNVPAWGGYEPDLPKVKGKGHRCEGSLPEAAYGKAITYCYEDVAGKLWITNEEYASQVNFCPYCGCKARVEVSRGVA